MCVPVCCESVCLCVSVCCVCVCVCGSDVRDGLRAISASAASLLVLPVQTVQVVVTADLVRHALTAVTTQDRVLAEHLGREVSPSRLVALLFPSSTTIRASLFLGSCRRRQEAVQVTEAV